MRIIFFVMSIFVTLDPVWSVDSSINEEEAVVGKNPFYGWGVPIHDRFGQVGKNFVLNLPPEGRLLVNAPPTHDIFQDESKPHGLNLELIAKRGTYFQDSPKIEDNGQDFARYVAPALAIKKKVVAIRNRITQLEQQCQSLMRPTLQASMGEVGIGKKLTYRKTYVEGELNTLMQASNHQPKAYNQARDEKIELKLKELVFKLSLLEQDLENGLKKIHELTGVPLEKLRLLPVPD
ncbi:MAG TPA: hypothetical protein DD412_00580 [Holosporales bacterium]|nr:hypothetical protein [Holosporales bacterium]